MKFSVTSLNITVSPRYPYSYRVGLIDYTTEEHDNLKIWIEENSIQCCVAGRYESVLYLTAESLSLFLLKWS